MPPEQPAAITTTPPHPGLPATPELNSPPRNAMNAHRATVAGIRGASGALPPFNGGGMPGNRNFEEGDEFEGGGGESGEEGEHGGHGEEEYDEEEEELEGEEGEEEEYLPRTLLSLAIHLLDPTLTVTYPARASSPLPENLREISSLASWTVSTHKPGCGVAALRHDSPSSYWQSDGPQPHALTLHFFKLVAVVRIRVYLDFNLDESYTPTKMVFLAGMGGNDLVEFASWEGEAPTGWVDIPLEGVGGRNNQSKEMKRRHRRKTKKQEIQGLRGYDSGVDEDYDMAQENGDDAYSDDDNDINDNDPTAGNVLKAMVIQMKICENHQNGKDTHVRGFQVFAQDDRVQGLGNARARRESRRLKQGHGEGDGDAAGGGSGGGKVDDYKAIGMEEPDWMGEPEIR
ncbi:anaphase promoting complex subunit doc1 [Arachnomyces sp. PD_36]|nr:anaphase promoting complex subunit doc1 [Arachnomyces sp. PD_36]